jgi:hypothetical protein
MKKLVLIAALALTLVGCGGKPMDSHINVRDSSAHPSEVCKSALTEADQIQEQAKGIMLKETEAFQLMQRAALAGTQGDWSTGTDLVNQSNAGLAAASTMLDTMHLTQTQYRTDRDACLAGE